MTATRVRVEGATALGTGEFTERLRAVAAERLHDRHAFNPRMRRGEPPGAPVADEVPDFLDALRREGRLT